MKTWVVAAAGLAAAGLALYLGRKKSSSASAPPDHIEPPPDRPPYKDPPTKQNPVGGFPGVQHFQLPDGDQLKRLQGAQPFYVKRPPESVTEAAQFTGLVGQFPSHVFEGSTALVEGRLDTSNPFSDKGVRLIARGGSWYRWKASDGPEVGFAPVVFHATKDGDWVRVQPLVGTGVAGFHWLS